MKNQTKKSKIQGKKNRKKGFTLVELLAVIIILAIVVGITIPAVLTTTSNARKRAFQTAAQTMADWIDRQYQVYQSGADDLGIATLDAIFKEQCTSASLNCLVQTSTGANYLLFSEPLAIAAGLTPSNIQMVTSASNKSAGTATNMTQVIINYTTNSSAYSKAIIPFSTVTVDASTGRSCVKLVAKSGGDYDTDTTAEKYEVMCGGSCSTATNQGRYCQNGVITCQTGGKGNCTFATE